MLDWLTVDFGMGLTHYAVVLCLEDRDSFLSVLRYERLERRLLVNLSRHQDESASAVRSKQILTTYLVGVEVLCKARSYQLSSHDWSTDWKARLTIALDATSKIVAGASPDSTDVL